MKFSHYMTGCTHGTYRGPGVELPFGGNCPVQGFGKIDGRVCYFRARDRGWAFEVWKPGFDPEPDDAAWFDGHEFYYGNCAEFEPFAGGWIGAGKAKELIEVGVKAYRAWVRAGRPAAGTWWPDRRWRRRGRSRTRAARFAAAAVLEHVAFASGRVAHGRSTPRPRWARGAASAARCFVSMRGYAWSPAEVLRRVKTGTGLDVLGWVYGEMLAWQARTAMDFLMEENAAWARGWLEDPEFRRSAFDTAREMGAACAPLCAGKDGFPTPKTMAALEYELVKFPVEPPMPTTYAGLEVCKSEFWKANATAGPGAGFSDDPVGAIMKFMRREHDKGAGVDDVLPPMTDLLHVREWEKAARGELAVNIFEIPVVVNKHIPDGMIVAEDAAGKIHVLKTGNGDPLSPSEAGQDGAGPVESRGGNEQALVQPSAGSPYSAPGVKTMHLLNGSVIEFTGPGADQGHELVPALRPYPNPCPKCGKDHGAYGQEKLRRVIWCKTCGRMICQGEPVGDGPADCGCNRKKKEKA